MKTHHLKTGLLMTVIGMLLFHGLVFANVDRLSISQIIQEGNDVYLYVGALDSRSRRISFL